jgi:hypothetical protein
MKLGGVLGLRGRGLVEKVIAFSSPFHPGIG